jgi:ribosome production factor 2
MIKPIILFQGEHFDFSTKHRRFKNFLIDFFRIGDYSEANIAEMKRVMVFTSTDESTLTFKQFEVNPGSTVNQTDVKNLTLNMSEVGPRFSLVWRRYKLASDELFKEACKQPKIRNPVLHKNRKNVYTDSYGQKHGKVFLQRADTNTLVTRKWKKQKPGTEAAKPAPE